MVRQMSAGFQCFSCTASSSALVLLPLLPSHLSPSPFPSLGGFEPLVIPVALLGGWKEGKEGGRVDKLGGTHCPPSPPHLLPFP